MGNIGIKRIDRYTLNGIAVPGWRFWYVYRLSSCALTSRQKVLSNDTLDRGEVVSLGRFEFQIVYRE